MTNNNYSNNTFIQVKHWYVNDTSMKTDVYCEFENPVTLNINSKEPRRGSPKPQPNHTEKGISSKHLKGPESMKAVHSISSQQLYKDFPGLLPHLLILLNFDPAVPN